MTSIIFIMIIILDTTSPGKGITIVTTGQVTDMAIGVIIMMMIAGAMREETVRLAGGLGVMAPREPIVMKSSPILSGDLEVQGLKGILIEVKALLHQGPLQVGHSQQPRGVLRVLEEIAKAGLLHLGVQSSPHVMDPVLSGL